MIKVHNTNIEIITRNNGRGVYHRMNGEKLETIVVTDITNKKNFLLQGESFSGYFRSYVNPNKCMNLENITSGKLKIYEYTDDGLIKSPLSPNECLSKGDREETSGNTTNGYLNPCIGSEKQVWQLLDIQPNTLFKAKTQDVGVYNPELISDHKLAIAITPTRLNGKFPSQKDGFYKSLKTVWYLDVIDIESSSTNKNEYHLTLNDCNNAQNDQK
ncbi:hypothetical protein H8356DRAFT_1434820 [Neocallimastix lanati (nom. inval.)]|nr:hypothetical protein H8356DRAFT_1434820 [Neocallimastix sp. JGI-2020a]